MRIGGLASGMDTDYMIDELMRVERMAVDRYFQQEQRLKWRQEAYTNINKNMANFILNSRKNFALATMTNTGVLKSNSVSSFDWVKRAISSDESIVKATANSGAMAGTHTIRVKQLAEVANIVSRQLTGDQGVLDKDLKFTNQGTFEINGKTIVLEDAVLQGEMDAYDIDTNFEEKMLIFAVNGQLVELDENYDSVEDMVIAINEQIEGTGVTLTINEDNKLEFNSRKDIVIASTDSEESLDLAETLGIGDGLVKANNSIDYLVKEINNAADEDGQSLGLRAAFDRELGKLMITSRESGADKKIEINIEGLEEGQGNIFNGDNLSVTGKDALITFNNEEISKATNNFTVFGVNLQLQRADESKNVTINVDADVDSIYDKIKEFVDEYNEIIDEISGQINEKYYRDYPPLTNEQKQAMTDKDIELWEERSKSGLLRRDATLTKVLQNMRSQLYEKVEGVAGSFSHITELGITTGAYQDGGKLVIDEQKLRTAINEDPEGVIDILFKSPDGNLEGSERTKESGLVQRVYDSMIGGMQDIIRQSGPGEDASLLRNVRSNILIDFVTKQSSISLLDKDLMDINKRIIREEERLINKENRYWAQFSAMEKALAQMQSQSMWLMSQMGMQ